MDDRDEASFRALLGRLRELWTTERFCESQEDVWRLLKPHVPRRARFSCHSVHNLLDMLVDREVVSPRETAFLERLAAVFSVQDASEHICAFRKVPLDSERCTLCTAPSRQLSPYQLPLQQDIGQREVVCAILYLCEKNCPWKRLVRSFPKNINVKEADIDRLEAMPCASDVLRKCSTCAGFEVLESWRKRYPQHATVELLLKCLAKEPVKPAYIKDIESGFHKSMSVSSTCLLYKSRCAEQVQCGEGVSVEIVCTHILNGDARAVVMQNYR